MRSDKVISIAPGKVIISGEYGALFGSSVIACSIKHNIKTELEFVDNHNSSPLITVEIPQKTFKETFALMDLLELVKKIDQNYQLFLIGKTNVILTSEMDLIKYILGYYLSIKPVNKRLFCRIDYTITPKIGMGSSAALILSVSVAIIKLLKIPYKDEDIVNSSITIENLQHGYSSGVDIKTSFFGGCLNVSTTGRFTKINIDKKILQKLFIIKFSSRNNTSETVNYVKKYFVQDKELWQKFIQITATIEQNFKDSDITNLINNIRQNNKLLTQLSVVPSKLQNIISYIERYGGAAKISGAGSLNDEYVGMLLIISEFNIVNSFAKKFGYNFERLDPSTNGVRYKLLCKA